MKTWQAIVFSVFLIVALAAPAQAYRTHGAATYSLGSPSGYSLVQPVHWRGHRFYGGHPFYGHRYYRPYYYRPYSYYYGYPYAGYYSPYYYGPGVSLGTPFFSFNFGY